MEKEEPKNYCKKEIKHNCTMTLSWLEFIRTDANYNGIDCVECFVEEQEGK